MSLDVVECSTITKMGYENAIHLSPSILTTCAISKMDAHQSKLTGSVTGQQDIHPLF
jgi:hypothetical protein